MSLDAERLTQLIFEAFNFERFKGSETEPVLLIVVTPAKVESAIPVPAAKFPVSYTHLTLPTIYSV